MMQTDKIIIPLVCWVIFALVLLGCATSTMTSKTYTLAKSKATDSEVRPLQRTARKAALKDAQNPEYWVEYGRASQLSNNPNKAEMAFRRALQLDDKYLPAYKHLGLVLAKSGLYQDAQKVYEKALQIFTKDSELWTAYGYCFVDLGDDKKALEAFQESIESSTDSISAVSARLGVSALLRRQGDEEAARHQYEEATKISPEIIEMLEEQKSRRIFATKTSNVMKSMEYAIKGAFKEAQHEFKKALKVDPSDKLTRQYLKVIEDVVAKRIKKETTVHYFKGVAYENKGMWDKAIAEYNKAISNNPDYVLVHLNRGWAYSMKGEYDKAISDYNKVIRIKPRTSAAYNNRGIAYFNKGEYDKAISDYNKAIVINPKNENCFLTFNNRAMAYDYKGQYDRAISDYNKAIAINPTFADSYNDRGIAYSKKGQYDKAISDYNRAVEINPKNYSAYYNRARVYTDKGEYDKAIYDYNKAIKINPRFANAYHNRGYTCLKKGLYDRAISDYNIATEINPRDAGAYYSRGFIYLKKGLYDHAILDFRKAIEINPRDAEAYNNRGGSYFQIGHYELAISDYNKAIEINPRDAEAYNNRGVVFMMKFGNRKKACSDFKRACGLGLCEGYTYAKKVGQCE